MASTLSEMGVVAGFEEVTRPDLCSESTALAAVGAWVEGTGRSLCREQSQVEMVVVGMR